MRLHARVVAPVAVLVLALGGFAAPAQAGSATYNGGGCKAKFTNSRTGAKTERTSGSCQSISVELYLYLNGSPGIYVWGPSGSTTGKSVSRARPSGYTVSWSIHSVLNGSGDTLLVV